MGVALGGGWHTLSTSVLAERFTAMAAAGVEVARFDINWHVVEGTEGNFSWTGHDNIVNACLTAGIMPILVIGSCPAWAATGGVGGWYEPADHADYASFCGTAAARYSARGIHHYEVWNEPNITAFWKIGAPSATSYADMLALGAAAIRAEDSAAFIITAGLSPATTVAGGNIEPVEYLTALYAAGAQGDFDGVGWHPYNTPNLPSEYASWSTWSKMDEVATSARDVMVANGDGDLQIWATEYGVATGGTGGTTVTEASQAEHVTDAFAELRADSWLACVCWYNWLGSETGDRVYYMGLVHADGSAKPALAAYTAAAALTS
jgi:hypothetical protein